LCPSREEEAAWGKEGLALLENYMQLEEPKLVSPAKREMWVKENLDVYNNETVLVRGIVDRLDLVRDDKNVVGRVIDYKSGKAPVFKYPPLVNERIRQDTFFQLLLYALLLRNGEMPVRYLQLFYLTSTTGKAQRLEMDLGASPEERAGVLEGVHEQVRKVYGDICDLVSQQDPRMFKGCTRSFCYCHVCRTRFEPGTVWEPE
jgi:RecB family exonuclease